MYDTIESLDAMTEKLLNEKSKRPLLTIAIPTFNRLDCLRLLIESVIHQIPSEGVLGETFELLICNNASTDGTTEYLNGFAAQKGIRVIHHPVNCGPVNNVIHCFESAMGKFVWVMGDDDVPLGGAINLVMECIKREQPALMYLPSKWVVGDLSELAKNNIESKAVTVLDSIGLAVRSSVYVTFISSWIINKDAYLSQQNVQLARYRDTCFPQLEWFFSLLANGNKFICAEDCWIIARAGSSGGYSVFETFSHQYNRIVDERLADSPQLHRFFRHCMLWCFIPGLVWGGRKNAIGNFGEFDKVKTMSILKSAYGNDAFFMFVVTPMVNFNKPVALCFWILARVMAKFWQYGWRICSFKTRQRIACNKLFGFASNG